MQSKINSINPRGPHRCKKNGRAEAQQSHQSPVTLQSSIHQARLLVLILNCVAVCLFFSRDWRRHVAELLCASSPSAPPEEVHWVTLHPRLGCGHRGAGKKTAADHTVSTYRVHSVGCGPVVLIFCSGYRLEASCLVYHSAKSERWTPTLIIAVLVDWWAVDPGRIINLLRTALRRRNRDKARLFDVRKAHACTLLRSRKCTWN